MATIRVTRGGCGIHYTDAHGNVRFALKTGESGPFECDDAQAARLVGMGVAVYVTAKADQPADQKEEQKDEPTETSQETEEETGHLDAEQLETMTNAQLKDLAGDLGIDVSRCKKKADYIAAIIAEPVAIPDEDDGDNLPELSAADPE